MARRLLATGLFILASLASGTASAINWEGHDDWLADSPPALELERHFDGRVRPLPTVKAKPDCQRKEEVGKVPVDPYEPVPMLCEENETGE